MSFGNFISQVTIEERSLTDLNWDRIIRFGAYGYLFSVNS